MLGLLIPALHMGAGASPVEIPDVVGETQAAGTTELETAGFVVAVATAYSSSVAAGLIISQDPVGGTFAYAGSTVTITVSLGAEPQSEDAAGGWEFWAAAERHRRERERRRKRLQEIEAETQDIQDALDREIAQRLKEGEEADERRKELERLEALVTKYAKDASLTEQLPKRVAESMRHADEKRSRDALLALQREISLMLEEEEAVAMLLLTLH